MCVNLHWAHIWRVWDGKNECIFAVHFGILTILTKLVISQGDPSPGSVKTSSPRGPGPSPGPQNRGFGPQIGGFGPPIWGVLDPDLGVLDPKSGSKNPDFPLFLGFGPPKKVFLWLTGSTTKMTKIPRLRPWVFFLEALEFYKIVFPMHNFIK